MNNLFSAGLFRLRRGRLLWGCLAVSFLGAAAIMLSGCGMVQRMHDSGSCAAYLLNDFLFEPVPMIGLVAGLFAAVFLGAEYGDGALRNKLMAGHTRRAVYLSSLGLCSLAALAIAAASLLGGLVGVPVLGGWQGGAAGLLGPLLACAGCMICFAALFTLVGMLCPRRTGTMALCLLSYLALLMLASYLYNSLSEPEMASGMLLTVNGVEAADPTPNPFYVGGSLRVIYELVLHLLPTGQAILLCNGELGPALPHLAASLALCVLITLAGAALFQRKDLK